MEEEIRTEKKNKTAVFVVIIVLLLGVIGFLTMRVMSSEKKAKEVETEQKTKEVEKESEKEKEKEREQETEVEQDQPRQNDDVSTPPAAVTSSFFTAPRTATKHDESLGVSLTTEGGNIRMTCSSECHKTLDSYWGKALKDNYSFNGDYISAKLYIVGQDASNLGIIAIRKDGTVSHNSLKNIANGATSLNPNYMNLKNIVSIEGAIIISPYGGGMQMVATDINGKEYLLN